IQSFKIPRVAPEERIFVGLSPALDIMVVTQSSVAKNGTAVNGVAVMDSHTFEILDLWHDDGESWNIAANRERAFRTGNRGTAVQMRSLAKNQTPGSQWKTIWSTSDVKIPRPIFLNNASFAIPVPGGVSVFSSEGHVTHTIECRFGASLLRAARSGNVLV